MTRDEAVAAMHSSPLAGFIHQLEDALLPSIRARSTRLEDPLDRIDASALGGFPALPPDCQWPTWNAAEYLQAELALHKKYVQAEPAEWQLKMIRATEDALSHPILPLSFLAQINLRDLCGKRSSIELPPTGLLSFFFEVSRQPWGFDPRSAGAFRVIYTPDTENLQVHQPPAHPGVQTFQPCSLEFYEAITLSANIPAVNAATPQRHDFFELLRQINGAQNGRHQIGGHPDPVQGEMFLECQLVTNGLYCGDPSGYNDPRAAAFRPGAADWTLLFQIDSDDNPGWMWGDSGMLYFCIRRQDLVRRNFNNTWLVLQCC